MNLTATLITTTPAPKTFGGGYQISVVTARVTAFGETRDIDATINYNDDGSVRCYRTFADFTARVGNGLKAYPINAILWPRPDGTLGLDLRGFVLRRSVVANQWRDQASQVTTRAGWKS